jgi:hypothetical protein
MTGKRLSLILAAAALLLLQFADCMSAMTPDQQSMQCCTSMRCTPANHSHGCCKTMTAPQTPSMVAAARVSLRPPILVIVGYTQTLEIARSAPVPVETVETRQESPPELYTLYASLLI